MSRFTRARKVHGQTVEGRRAVLESLRAKRELERIIMADGLDMGPQLREIVFLADEAGLPVDVVPRGELERQSHTKKHQGVIAVAPDPQYSSIEDIVLSADRTAHSPLLVMLDGIQDPHNLGAIARSLDAAGGHGMVIPERRSAAVSPGAIRASAGALEHVRVARVVNLSRTATYLKDLGLRLIGLSADAELDFTEADYTGPTALVVGSEEKGISRILSEKCDDLVSIPMHGNIASLNASISAALVLYEAERQRNPRRSPGPAENLSP